MILIACSLFCSYYASVLLFAFAFLLCQKLCQQNRRIPNDRPPTQLIIAHIENIPSPTRRSLCELPQCYKVLSLQGV